jgi:hypothetical protein
MDEDGAYDALRAFLLKLATDALLIDPARAAFGDVIRDAQGAPRPQGAYAMIEFLADRDLEEFTDERYSTITTGSGPGAEERVLMCKSRGVEWLFRVNIYAPRPINWARLFVSGLRSAESSVWMAPLVVRDVRDIKRSPELIQQRWEGRAMFEVILGAVATEPLLIDVVETGEVITEGAGGSTVTAGFTYSKP